MNASLSPLTPNPVQFRVRALIRTTAFVAVLAAVAGPYFRSQSREGQMVLLAFWSCVAASAALCAWLTWRKMWRQPAGAGPVDFLLWQAPNRYWGAPRILVLTALSILGCLWLLGFSSKYVVTRWQAGATSWPWLVCQIGFSGMFVAWALRWVMPTPVRFGALGMLMGSTPISWSSIRTAEWAWSRPDILMLHRSEGDIYAAVPAELQPEVEAYLRTKTHFIGLSRCDNELAHGQ